MTLKFNHLQKRCKTIGLSAAHARYSRYYFARQFDRMHNPERAIAFFKDLGKVIEASVSDADPSMPWIAVHKGDKLPKRLRFLREYNSEVRLRFSKIARSAVLQRITDKQVQKVRDAAINGPTVDESYVLRISEELLLRGVSVDALIKSRECKVLLTEPNYPNVCRKFKRITASNKTLGSTGAVDRPPTVESMFRLINSPDFMALPYPFSVFRSLRQSGIDKIRTFVTSENYQVPQNPGCVGEIHAAQEGGGKLRMFASPYLIFQELLTPLHDWLDKIRSTYLSDCTYNQEAGAIWAQDKLKQGRVVASVDLSTATCRYWLLIQIRLLQILGCPQPWINALIHVCRGDWSVGPELSEAFGLRYMAWAVGQPLGIRPSMSLFSLSHNVTLRGMAVEAGLDPDDSFRILGDDVVMVEALYERYTTYMSSIGVPISWSKTHVSRNFAEFAGFGITRDWRLRPGQWRPATKVNHISLADEFGPLVHEVGDVMLVVEKVLLFQKGKYSPPLSYYSRYIRAASALVQEHLVLNMPDMSLPSYEEGLHMSLIREDGLVEIKPWDMAYISFPDSVISKYQDFAENPRVKYIVDEYVGLVTGALGELPEEFDHPSYHAHFLMNHITGAVTYGAIDLDMATEMVRILEEALWASVYSPPRNMRPELVARRFHRKLLKLWGGVHWATDSLTD